VRVIADHQKNVLVYDIGGSHVSAALCFEGDYRLGPTVIAHHPEEQSSDAFVETLHALGLKAAPDIHNVLGAELAMPGPFDYTEGVSWMRHKMPYLYGVNLRDALAQRFDWQTGQVHFLNDAAAHLLGEIGAGAARGVHRAVSITLGTGVGSAFAIDGRIVTHGPGVPAGGEIWNLPYEGHIVEDFISTRAIQQSYLERTGEEREVAAIASGANENPAAVEIFTEFGRRLGVLLRELFSAFAPDVVVLGGGIARSAPLFLAVAQDQVKEIPIELRISALGDPAPLVGAGVAWFADSTVSRAKPVSEALHSEAP
jgi:glucokinase